jgi:hypothetical protein
MRNPSSAILTGVLALVLLSCTREEPVGEEGIADGASSGAARGGPADERESAEPDPVEPLLDGSHSVFGLRVPRGMKPAKGPNQVYRFEGTLELGHVKRYVMRQVETGHLLEEPTGYLVRKARVVEPVGSSRGDLLLAVRIFRGRRGGASVDVWVEAESLAELRSGRGGLPGYGAGGAGKDDERPPAKLSSTQTSRRAEQRKQTFEAIEAAAQGKGLPRDPDNPLSY